MSVQAVTPFVGDPNQRPDGVPEGCCWCGCGVWLAARRANTRYVDARHRQAHHRARLRDAARAVGIPASLSFRALGALDQANGTGKRRGDARKPRKPDLRISYRKAVERVAARLMYDDPHLLPFGAQARAHDTLGVLLTDRQWEALGDADREKARRG